MTENVQNATVQTETPTPGAENARPPLRRSRTDLLLGGVCGGLARHTGIDALLWRVGFAAPTLAGGSGLALYVVLWLFMPAAPAGPAERTNVLDEWVERLRTRFNQPNADISRASSSARPMSGGSSQRGTAPIVAETTDSDAGPFSGAAAGCRTRSRGGSRRAGKPPGPAPAGRRALLPVPGSGSAAP